MSPNVMLFVALTLSLLLCFPAAADARKVKSTASLRASLKLAAMHASDDQHTRDVAEMQRSIYSMLDQHSVPDIVTRFRSDFKRLDVDGSLANTLDALYEMRLMDMQVSVARAKKMRSVLDAFGNAQ
jgi:hypothetical protein